MKKKFTAMLRQQSKSLIITVPVEIVNVMKLKRETYIDVELEKVIPCKKNQK